MKIKSILLVLLGMVATHAVSAQKTSLLRGILRTIFYTPPTPPTTPNLPTYNDNNKLTPQNTPENSPYLIGSMGLASPHGLIGLGVILPQKKFMEWEFGMGLPLTYAFRMSAGANLYLTKNRKQTFGVSLAYSFKPSTSTVVAVNNSDYTFYDNQGNQGKVFVSPNSMVIRYGADIADAKGNSHNYWIVNNSTQAFYDFKSVATLHFRYSIELRGVRTSLGYGVNFSKPYEFSYGNSAMPTDWLEAVTPGGIELSMSARLFHFNKQQATPSPMPTPLIPQNNPTIVQPKVAPEVKTVILKDTIVIQSQLVDTDNDGVIDAVDKCPTVAGSPANYGCPLEISQEVKKVMITAMQNVQFETGKATLENKSYELLDQVVRVMREHPEYRLRIEGHTDNIGNENINQMLSQSRAIVCLQYLVSKGIESSRLSSAGFGATRPIADNNAKDGRDRNRRVEFIIH